MAETQEAYWRCPLCGFEFAKADTPCARGCPLQKSCSLISCPNCCYEFPMEPKAVGWWRRLFSRPEPPFKPPSDLFALTELEEGDCAEVVRLTSEKASRKNTLAVYGLVPGRPVTLRQKRPAIIVRIGETELALDTDIAREILVKRIPCAHAAALTRTDGPGTSSEAKRPDPPTRA